MSAIGNLTTLNTVFNLDFLPENLLIGSTTEAFLTDSISVVSSGVQLMSITNIDRINALAQFDQGVVLGFTTNVPRNLKLAVGRINKQTTINIGSPVVGSNTPVFAVSSGIGGIARRAVEQSINPSANASFENFEALFFKSDGFDNVILRVNLEFENGFSDEFSPQEIDALFASYNATENAQLSGLSVIRSETPNGLIVRATIYNGNNSLVVLKTDYVAL